MSVIGEKSLIGSYGNGAIATTETLWLAEVAHSSV